MSTWDHIIFEDEAVQEFFEDLDELDYTDLSMALKDAIVDATKNAEPGQQDYTVGLGASSLVAIWSGAPYAVADIADRFPFVRGHIGHASQELVDAALELLDGELERLGEDVPEGLETYVEALS
ncbi:hypothetical protein GC425_03545 [Corynebacterium sp. zg254]|uniref:DUF4259 domain-containing protein n=1 Tax=Corynebacterium zhongnanshanii TaxID=2768834 RepID=A0ABQ6VEX7_9CORY|nr:MULTISPECIES: DUF4259 domain-containing protein [Corynebacterium]KAB3522974.1 hypothetical protein F8377_02075 [Corynebacterium zhongnanshanii]MCR5913943.1 hypothetical protein [Corynebacterium sp. zg254]